MKTYYRFLINAEQIILEFDTEMVSFEYAQGRARQMAKSRKSPFEYQGIFKHEEF